MLKYYELKRERKLFFIKKSICVKIKKNNHLISFDLYENTTYFGMFFKSILLERRSFSLKRNLPLLKIVENKNEISLLFNRQKELNVLLINDKTLKFTYRTIT